MAVYEMSYLIHTLIAVATASTLYTFDVNTDNPWEQVPELDSEVTVYEILFDAWDLAGELDSTIGTELVTKTAWDLVPELDSTVIVYGPKDKSDN